MSAVRGLKAGSGLMALLANFLNPAEKLSAHTRDAAARDGNILGIELDPDERAAMLDSDLCHRTGTEKRIKHEISRPRGQPDARLYKRRRERSEVRFGEWLGVDVPN